MSGTIYTGTLSTGVILQTPSTQNPATIASTGYVSKTGVAVLGTTGTAWTVANYGTVAGLGTAGSGIYLQSGGTLTNGGGISATLLGFAVGGGNGTLTNNAGASISAGNIAAYFSTATSFGVVSNSGLLQGTASNGIGAFMGGGGNVANVGTIAGVAEGVQISTRIGTVANFGAITSSGASGIGIGLAQGGVVTNGAVNSITPIISALSIGVYGQRNGAAVTLTNFGTIRGSGANGLGIFLGTGGTVTSSGTIEGGIEGVGIDGGTGVIVNTGFMQSIYSSGVGVVLSAGGSVQNGSSVVSTATLQGSTGGISITGSAGTVLNFGLIQGFSGTGVGVSLAAGGTFTNSGTVSKVFGGRYAIRLTGAGTILNAGNLTGNSIAVVGSGSGAMTVANSGTIIGSGGTSIQLGSGNDRVIASPGALFAGIVNAGGGSNVLELAAGASQGQINGFGTSFTNFGSVVLDAGASWRMVQINPSLSATITIGSGATLGIPDPVGAGTTIVMSGTSETLRLSDPYDFNGTISIVQSGTIDIVGQVVTSLASSGNMLYALNGDSTIAHFALAGNYAGANYAFASDNNGGTNIVIAPPPKLYQFLYTYGDGRDSYLGTVSAIGGTYALNQVITNALPDQSGTRGNYKIIADLGNTGQAVGTVQIGLYYVGAAGASYAPYFYSTGQASGFYGLGTEFDYLAVNGGYSSYFGNYYGYGVSNSNYPYYEASRQPQSVADHLYEFQYTYGNNSDYYIGTVSAAYGTYTLNQQVTPTANDQTGARGRYLIFADLGVTGQAAGSVQIGAYYSRSANNVYTPYAYSVGALDGYYGLGTEFDYLNIHGGYTSYFGNIAGSGSASSHPYYLAA